MTENRPAPTNNAGGPYNDEQAKHTRPEHDPRRWAEPCPVCGVERKS